MQLTRDLVPAAFRKYVGRRPYLADQHLRAVQMAFTMTNEGLARPGSPFWQVSVNGLLLNDETYEYIYNGDFGKITNTYRRGTHPVLEKYIDSLITAGMSDREKIITLSQSMDQHLIKCYPKVPVFLYNESDEHTLLKGGGHCSCRARLLTAMAQMLGIQARPAMQWAWIDLQRDPNRLLGGHTVAEVYLDGKWCFFDPQHHSYGLIKGGEILNLWEIRHDRERYVKGSLAVHEQIQPVPYQNTPDGMNDYEYYWYKNVQPGCPIQISRYDSTQPYQSAWLWATKELREGQAHDFAQLRDLLLGMADRGEITDELYAMSKSEFERHMGLTDVRMPSLEVAGAA